MDITEDDRATAIWNDLLDAIPGDVLSMDGHGHLFTLAYAKLHALGYSKEDCNDFLNANLAELDPV